MLNKRARPRAARKDNSEKNLEESLKEKGDYEENFVRRGGGRITSLEKL